VLFFDKKPASATPWTSRLWIYDFRTNQSFTLKQRPLRREDLADFVACYRSGNLQARQESERFRGFAYDELVARDKANLDILWLKDQSLEDADNLPPPAVLAAEIIENLEAALEQFREVATALGTDVATEPGE
jgi:type I restriction enzyme M protein